MIHYAEAIALDRGFQLAEIGVNDDNRTPLNQYVRNHYHEHPLFVDKETEFTYPHPIHGSFTMPRCKWGIAVYKYLGRACAEHGPEEIVEKVAEILSLLD
jgi:hypothetical protein